MALTGTLSAYFVQNKTNDNNLGLFSILLVVAIGSCVGLLVGFIQVKTKIPSFLLTFAVSNIMMGITLLVYKGIMIGIEDKLYLSIASASFIGIPVLMWISIAMFVVAYIIQEYTAFGRYIYAIGSNENIPRSTGINVNRIKILVFGFSGLCIGLAGALGASRIAFGDISIGRDTLFPAMTAVVLGGTALSGGKGGVVNTLIGAVIVAVLRNGLILLGVAPTIITGIQGLIILAAVAFSVDRSKGQANK
jgi:ribose transport system permease protein